MSKQLRESIESLEDTIQNENKTSRVFLRGIVGGFGRALGATVIFALVAIVVSALLYQLGWFPDVTEYLRGYIPETLE